MWEEALALVGFLPSLSIRMPLEIACAPMETLPPVSLRTQNVKQNKCSHLATENALLSGHCQPHRGSEDGRHLHFHGEMCLEGLLPLVGSPSPL